MQNRLTDKREDTLKALFATKTLLTTNKKGLVTEVWKGSQHLGDFSKEGKMINACKYDSQGFSQHNFDSEADALDWVTN